MQRFDVSMNSELHEAVPLLLSAARNLKIIKLINIPIDDQELLEMAQALQSNTSLIQLCIDSDNITMRYIFDSLADFVKIVTAPESKSRLEKLVFGKFKECKVIGLLSSQLTQMAVSCGHNLSVCLTSGSSKLSSFLREQVSIVYRMPHSLFYGK